MLLESKFSLDKNLQKNLRISLYVPTIAAVILKPLQEKKNPAGLFNCFSVVRLHLWDRVGVDTRCVRESTFLRERKVPAVMATSTGVYVCVSVATTQGSWSAVVSCRRLHSLIKQPISGADDAVE